MRLDDADYETGDAERRPLVHPINCGKAPSPASQRSYLVNVESGLLGKTESSLRAGAAPDDNRDRTLNNEYTNILPDRQMRGGNLDKMD